MVIPHEHTEIAEVHNLIVPMILSDTQKNYSEFIAFLLWRIPQIMTQAIREYNEGERIPSGVIATPVEEPDDPIPHTRVFTDAKVNTWVLTVRKGPDRTFEAVGYALRDEHVKVYEEKVGWSCIDPIRNHWVSSTYLTPL